MLITNNFNLPELHVNKLLNVFCLLIVFDSANHENEPINTCVDVTSDVAGKEEKLVIGASSYQPQMSKDPLSDLQTELPKHSHCLPSTLQNENNSGSIARAVDNTGFSDRPKRYLHHNYVY